MKLEDEISKRVLETKKNGNSYLYMESRVGEVILGGNFSDIDGLNFITALAQERPQVYQEFKKWKPRR